MLITKQNVAKTLPQYSDMIRRMKTFLSVEEPRLTITLSNAAREMQNSITYEEIREQLLRGGIDQATIERWMQRYVEFFVSDILPNWKESIIEGSVEVTGNYDLIFDPNTATVQQWVVERSGKMIVNITQQQRIAVNQLIQRAVRLNDIHVDELAKIIRPMIGLTPAQATANMRFFETVRNTLMSNGMSPTKATQMARKKSIIYGEQQHRYRAQSIARTELMEAYRAGEHNAIKQAQAAGLMPRVRKTLVDAGDSRVCNKCKELQGQYFEIDDKVPYQNNWEQECGGVHPCCRCVWVYQEVWEND